MHLLFTILMLPFLENVINSSPEVFWLNYVRFRVLLSFIAFSWISEYCRTIPNRASQIISSLLLQIVVVSCWQSQLHYQQSSANSWVYFLKNHWEKYAATCKYTFIRTGEKYDKSFLHINIPFLFPKSTKYGCTFAIEKIDV